MLFGLIPTLRTLESLNKHWGFSSVELNVYTISIENQTTLVGNLSCLNIHLINLI